MSGSTALHPPNEAERLEAVRRYDVLDTPPDGAFERVTALAANHFEVPIAIVSIVDTDRIWFKSHHGLEVEEIGRDPGLCASAILQSEPWVLEDASADPRALANPLVAGEFGLRFYAGAPLTTRDGHNLGTLCVIDHEPREFSDRDTATLQDMAAIVMDELELRLAARKTVEQAELLRVQAESMARALQKSLLPSRLPEIPGADIAAVYVPADLGEVGGDFYDAFEIGRDHWALVIGDVSGKGPDAAAVTGLARHTVRAAALSGASPAEVLGALNRAVLLGRTAEGSERFCTALVVFAEKSLGGYFDLTLAAAGHPKALVVSADRAVAEVGRNGCPAGFFPEAEFTEATSRLDPGQAIVLYTDGITEARTQTGLLGVDGLASALATSGAGAQALTDGIGELIEADPEIDVRDDAAALVLSCTVRKTRSR